jgi:hypothetical protein
MTYQELNHAVENRAANAEAGALNGGRTAQESLSASVWDMMRDESGNGANTLKPNVILEGGPKAQNSTQSQEQEGPGCTPEDPTGRGKANNDIGGEGADNEKKLTPEGAAELERKRDKEFKEEEYRLQKKLKELEANGNQDFIKKPLDGGIKDDDIKDGFIKKPNQDGGIKEPNQQSTTDGANNENSNDGYLQFDYEWMYN